MEKGMATHSSILAWTERVWWAAVHGVSKSLYSCCSHYSPWGQTQLNKNNDTKSYLIYFWGLRHGDMSDPFSESVQFSSVAQSCLTLCNPMDGACQASMSITNSQSLLKLMSIELVMPSNHLILCCPLLLLPSIFPSIRVFSKESVLHIRWPKYWSLSFSISPSNEQSGLISFRMD